MIDTIRIFSEPIDEVLASRIESLSRVKLCFDKKINLLEYEFSSFTLQNTYDSKLLLRVARKSWVSVVGHDGKKITVLKDCKPFLILECSIHKFIVGHNVYGGSDELLPQVKYLLNCLSSEFALEFPDVSKWYLERLDYALAFKFKSLDDVKFYIRSLNNSSYARRNALKFGDTGCYFPGSTTTLKFYAKGSEFKKHDKPRLSLHYKVNDLCNLQLLADCILRVELEVKKRKMISDFGDVIKVVDFKSSYFSELFTKEVKKVVKIVDDDIKVVSTAQEVKNRIFENYDEKLANILLGFWYQLSVFGESEVRKSSSKSSFYRKRNQLFDIGVSWIGNDLIIDENKAKFDFMPISTDLTNFVCLHDLMADVLVKYA